MYRSRNTGSVKACRGRIAPAMTLVKKPVAAEPPGSGKRKKVAARHPTKRAAVTSGSATTDGAVDRPDLLEFLASILKRPLSLLAVLAQHDGLISGSQALEFIFPGYGSTSESDLDVYVPQQKGALEDVSRVLSHAGVLWSNSFVGKFEELNMTGTIALPCAMIKSLAAVLMTNNWSTEDLHGYLKDRFSKSGYSESAKLEAFLDHIETIVETCRDSLEWKLDLNRKMSMRSHELEEELELKALWEAPTNWIWILNLDAAQPSILHSMENYQCPDIVDNLIEIMNCCQHLDKAGLDWSRIDRCIDTLFHYDEPTAIISSAVDSHHNGVRIATSETKFNVGTLKKKCNEDGITEQMLYDYISYTITEQEPYTPRPGKGLLISNALRIRQDLPCDDYQNELGILRGELSNAERTTSDPAKKKKVQVIIDRAHFKLPLHTVLQFYATHVMCFIGGTLGAHLFYSTAIQHKSLVLDFRKDPRQFLAKRAIEKYRPRGWRFFDMKRELVSSRSTCDEHTKMIDFEPLYAEALKKVKGTSAVLPPPAKAFFSQKKNSFKTFTWVIEHGRIPKYGIHNRNPAQSESWSEIPRTTFLDWVHQELDGHPHVIPKAEWEKEDTMRTALDIWFGGFRLI